MNTTSLYPNRFRSCTCPRCAHYPVQPHVFENIDHATGPVPQFEVALLTKAQRHRSFKSRSVSHFEVWCMLNDLKPADVLFNAERRVPRYDNITPQHFVPDLSAQAGWATAIESTVSQTGDYFDDGDGTTLSFQNNPLELESQLTFTLEDRDNIKAAIQASTREWIGDEALKEYIREIEGLSVDYVDEYGTWFLGVSNRHLIENGPDYQPFYTETTDGTFWDDTEYEEEEEID